MGGYVHYPQLQIDLDKIASNARCVTGHCKQAGIEICGVVKGVHAMPEVAKAMLSGGCTHIGDARLDNLKRLREAGVQEPLLLTRLPMLSEVGQLVDVADISLNSERLVIEAIDRVAGALGRTHSIILMADLGDLREGIMDEQELLNLAAHVESLEHVTLLGLGTNLGCYGAVKPNGTNLRTLVTLAEQVEATIGRALSYISGGATSSLPLVLSGDMPCRVNHLRIGEGILLGRDLPDLWNVQMAGMERDSIVVQAQIIELKSKPSYPIGERFVDAFGNVPEFEDRGIECRAILALGKQDYAYEEHLIPLDPNVKIVGSSSDHLIVALPEGYVQVGDVLPFGMYYGAMLFLSGAEGVHRKLLTTLR